MRVQATPIDAFTYTDWKPQFFADSFSNISANLQKPIKRLSLEPNPEIEGKSIALCGYGPSMRHTIDLVKKYDHIMTCSGAHDLLISNGIIPTYHVECDARAHKANFTKNPHPDVNYLMGSTVGVNIINRLMDYNLELWNIWIPPEIFKYPDQEQTIMGLGSVGLQLVALAYLKGYRKFGVFGMDCSYGGNNETHAGDHPNRERAKAMWIGVPEINAGEVSWKCYETEPIMAIYALEWRRLMNKVFSDCQFEVIGYGLLPAVLTHECHLPNGDHRIPHPPRVVKPATIGRVTGDGKRAELQEGIRELSEQADPEKAASAEEQSPPSPIKTRQGPQRGREGRGSPKTVVTGRDGTTLELPSPIGQFESFLQAGQAGSHEDNA